MLRNTAVAKQWMANGLILRMLFSELYKIMVNKVTLVGFRGAIDPTGSAPAVTYFALRTGLSKALFPLSILQGVADKCIKNQIRILIPCNFNATLLKAESLVALSVFLCT